MQWAEFLMSLITGGILIIFRCWFESKWRQYDHHSDHEDDEITSKTKK
ncbi:hypothetical protein HIR68_08380 [Staphylococcus coagulans]|uniref:Uncharacterized protein n=1 Tax=Staphylococcus coagulans TaxID=74706 RepID=A0A9X1EFQ6_9STAP|nr:hypothetical protein [Staphylococcus coagulans]MBA8777422.1 hypothetical protein [Staphylococcus coagulans]MBT2830805.1 hypothetical protein [Staphylococcus coagulans]MBT2860381.1 hypothetical protein [Staphylococcus coagulans]MBU3873410.1 hypothetical protein [Staphylococcus coagulans]